MSVSPSIKTYPDIGEFTSGDKGRILISIFLYLELYFVAIEFLILEGDNLHKLFPNARIHIGCLNIVGREVFIFSVAIIILLTTWLRSLDLLAYVFAGEIWRWNGLISTISMSTFCYCGHGVVPTICNSMKDRSQFPKVLFVCFILSTMTMGFLMYGQDLMSQITLNLPTGKIIATAIEDKLPLQKSKFIVSYFIRTFLFISTVIVALTVPFFGYVIYRCIIGCYCVYIVTMPLCYLKIKKPSYLEVMFIELILVFGSSVAKSGTYTS
ncbi:unnamed protein product [Withania somnifera]